MEFIYLFLERKNTAENKVHFICFPNINFHCIAYDIFLSCCLCGALIHYATNAFYSFVLFISLILIFRRRINNEYAAFFTKILYFFVFILFFFYDKEISIPGD